MKSGYCIPIEPSHSELPGVMAYSIGNPTKEKVCKVLDSYKVQNNPLIGYFIDETLVAAIGLEVSKASAIIRHINVLPKYQSSGIGRNLVQYVMKLFSLEILSAETDEDAVGFYQTMGFECSGYEGKYGRRYKCICIVESPK